MSGIPSGMPLLVTGVVTASVHRSRVCSHCCQWDALCRRLDVSDGGAELRADPGWTQQWSATWSIAGSPVVFPLRELASVPLRSVRPVRGFTWRRSQRNRAGLQYLVSTGLHHGFESLAEQRLLLALDFAGSVTQVCSQPFSMRYLAMGGWRNHIPDFLAVTDSDVWIVDVRPEERVDAKARLDFAATAEVALAAGWRFVAVIGWQPQVMTVVDSLSAQRRPLADRLGLQEQQLLSAAAGGATQLGDLTQQTSAPAMARAFLLHLLWWRRLAVDLSQPLGDTSWVWPAAHERWFEP